ncbi:prepilin peptidase [Tatumella saanichensis]|uniref:prepilin peptidase n=1 Tax=Tatumella saanichensis TaxID=480813 RepID=UPI0004A2C618|nr:prepilin peptidase [Tatumella saanichensis]
MSTLDVIFITAAWLMVLQAQAFIRRHQGRSPRTGSIIVIITLFTLTFSVCRQHIPNQQALFNCGIFLLWGVLFTVTDISNHWLPRRFTMSFTLCGAIMVIAFNGGEAFVRHLFVWLSLGLFFYLSGHLAVRCGIRPQGVGDTLLISGCGFWMCWQNLCLITGSGFLLLFIHGVVTHKRVLPFAPYFYLAFSIVEVTGLLIME